MNKEFKNEIVGFGTTPKFNNEMLFCVRVDTIDVALEDCSRKELALERSELPEQMPEDHIGVNLDNLYEYQNSLIERQDDTIQALEEQVSDYEQELFQKDSQITQIEDALRQVCKKMFLEVNPL
jgi:hypothetical protein